MKMIKKYWGFTVLIAFEIVFIAVLLMFHDKILVQVNDNLDSNVALMKISHDNQFWKDRTSPTPILGGLSRDTLNFGYTLSNILYYIFDTEIAYWLNYIIAVAMSSSGFWFIGYYLKKIFGADTDPNIFAVFGMLYMLSGVWPSSLIAFAVVPWLFVIMFAILDGAPLWLAVFYSFIITNGSFVLIGVFIGFWFCILMVFFLFQKNINRKRVVFNLISYLTIVCVVNFQLFIKMFSNSGNIKALSVKNGVVYTDGIRDIFNTFINTLFVNINREHASGIYGYGMIWVVIAMMFAASLMLPTYLKREEISKEGKIALFCVIAIIGNALISALNDAAVRKFFSFLSGLSIYRALWTSGFFLIIIIAIMGCMIKKRNVIIVIGVYILMCISFLYDSSNIHPILSYNLLSTNFNAYVFDTPVNNVSFKDFYQEKMFKDIKEHINYDGQWSCAYGIEPAVLSYNGINTLDGYYSNYSIEYKEKWEKVIAPELEINYVAKNYWEESNGMRAYLYSSAWEMPDWHTTYWTIDPMKDELELVINSEALKDMGCKYIFSRVRISNRDELGLEELGVWDSDTPDYALYVYQY